MEKNKNNSRTILKFSTFSLIGIIIFFINFTIGGKSKVPLIHIIDGIKGTIGISSIRILIMLICISVLLMSVWAKFGKNVPSGVKEHHAKDTMFSYFTYFTATIFSVMVIFNVGPAQIIDPSIGASSVKIAGDVIFASTIAGGLVVFLTEFGLLEFLGKLLEPIMRVIFKLPGKSAIDAISSFVCAPAVGVMITNGLYRKNTYTDKEACSITTNFSIASLGGFAFLSSMAGVGDYYSQVVLTALIAVFVVAIIMIRIPPLSKKDNKFFDGSIQSEENRKAEKYSRYTIKDAMNLGLEKAESAKMDVFWKGFKAAALFAQKITAYVVSLSVICLVIAKYTPVTSIIGAPMVPILNLLGLPDAALIAPSTLAGFLALSLPATLITGKGVAAMSGFFIVVLSTTQIIFFTESANAMLDSDIPVNFWDLLIIFILRTVILIPLIAFAAHIIF